MYKIGGCRNEMQQIKRQKVMVKSVCKTTHGVVRFRSEH